MSTEILKLFLSIFYGSLEFDKFKVAFDVQHKLTEAYLLYLLTF